MADRPGGTQRRRGRDQEVHHLGDRTSALTGGAKEAPSGSPSAEIGYVEFGEWYDRLRADVLEPALEVAESSLHRALTELLSERNQARIRSTTGRVKSKRRTWRKIRLPRYEQQVSSLDDIVGAIDDLVGLRVTCINLRDIDMIRAALDGLPRSPGNGLWIDAASERDYVAEPKESGYRGWHVNLGIEVGDVPVVCELQVRTLLQDSWGELTHEQSYSKDGASPPLVDVLSSRMADLLSILDDIAEDLRTELDRIDQEVVAEPDDTGSVDVDALAGQAADAAAMLQSRWRSISRPTDLAGLAWELQREFGSEINDDWFGHRSFKRFLQHAVPESEISTGRQAYLLPLTGTDAARPRPSLGIESAVDDTDRGATPGSARQLCRIDPEFPLLTGTEWPVLFEYLAESRRRIKPVDASATTVNRLSRSARDLARGGGTPLARRPIDYVVKALLAREGGLTPVPSVNAAQLADQFADATVERMVELRIIEGPGSRAASAVRRWIAGPT